MEKKNDKYQVLSHTYLIFVTNITNIFVEKKWQISGTVSHSTYKSLPRSNLSLAQLPQLWKPISSKVTFYGQIDLLPLFQIACPNIPFLQGFQLGWLCLALDELMWKGSRGQDMFWTTAILTVHFQTTFTASSSKPTFLPRVWLNDLMMVQ